MSEICPPQCPIGGPTSQASSLESNPVDDLGKTLAQLARDGVSPDAFSQEPGVDRFVSLTACSPQQRSAFEDTVSRLGRGLSSLPTDEIVKVLKGLVTRAYRYRENSRDVVLANPQAKNEIDLWIALLYRQAYQDAGFLGRIKTAEIEKILSFNSPHLSPEDRGACYRLDQGFQTQWDSLALYFKNLFDWLSLYDGKKTDWANEPFMISGEEAYRFFKAHLGAKEFQRLYQLSLPRETIKAGLERLGLRKTYERLFSLADDRLVARWGHLVRAGMGPTMPRLRKKLVEEAVVIERILDERGVATEDLLTEDAVKAFTDGGKVPRDEAKIMAIDTPVLSASRLDDYEARQRVLGKFEKIYREFLSVPLGERFSPERSERYDRWAQGLLNRSITGIPLSLNDIELVRAGVQEEMAPEPSQSISWEALLNRSREGGLWLRSADLVPNECHLDDPLQALNRISILGVFRFSIGVGEVFGRRGRLSCNG